MSEEKLSKIQDLLEDIKGLLLLANQDKIEETKKNAIRPGSIEETIYDLCREKISSEEIATKINKDTTYVRAVVSKLRRKGLIKTTEQNKKKIHEQRF